MRESDFAAKVGERKGSVQCSKVKILRFHGKPNDPSLKPRMPAPSLGVMIEIPSAAIRADLLADEADFFSIGTNDLLQHTFAADRTNETVTGTADYFNPAFLSLIAHIIDRAHEKGKPVGMCGEMAGDPQALPLLLALGLDDFSMAAGSIPVI